jgi:hypothetical protein
MIKYSFNEEINEENLRDFIDKFESGLIPRYLKSEYAPEKNDKTVKILVGENFRNLVFDS